jgi:hypothetical protein
MWLDYSSRNPERLDIYQWMSRVLSKVFILDWSLIRDFARGFCEDCQKSKFPSSWHQYLWSLWLCNKESEEDEDFIEACVHEVFRSYPLDDLVQAFPWWINTTNGQAVKSRRAKLYALVDLAVERWFRLTDLRLYETHSFAVSKLQKGQPYEINAQQHLDTCVRRIRNTYLIELKKRLVEQRNELTTALRCVTAFWDSCPQPSCGADFKIVREQQVLLDRCGELIRLQNEVKGDGTLVCTARQLSQYKALHAERRATELRRMTIELNAIVTLEHAIEQASRFKGLNPRRDFRRHSLQDLRNAKSAIESALRVVHTVDERALVRRRFSEVNLEDLVKRLDETACIAEQRERERASAFSRIEELLNVRCAQTVAVFNSVYNLQIASDAVLESQLEGEFASIQSASRRSSDVGISYKLEQTLTQTLVCELHRLAEDRTWLTIEEGDTVEEMQDVFDSSNMLIWHELCHLVKPSIIKKIRDAVPLETNLSTEVDAQANEIVLDAFAIRIGVALYVHPSPCESLSFKNTERMRLMCSSHAVLVYRVIRWFRGKDIGNKELVFIVRLLSELDIHAHARSKNATQARKMLLEIFGDKLASYQTLRKEYVQLYAKALVMPDLTSISFRKSLMDETDDEESSAQRFGVARQIL